MRRCVIASILVLAAVPAAASQSFTNFGAFVAALGGSYTVHGFDNLPPGTVLNTQLAGVDFQNSATVGASGSAQSPPNVLRTTASPIGFLFGPSARAVGFYNTSSVDETVTYVSENFGGTLFQSLVPPGGFLGYISDTPIGYGTIGWIGPPNSEFSIDTFVFRPTGTAVPTATPPALWGIAALMTTLGLLGIGRRHLRTPPRQ